MTFVFLNDILGVIVCVERVHENERDIDIIGAVEVLDLSDGQVEERHAITDLDDRLRADAAHGGTQTTIELEHRKLAQESDGLGVCKLIVIDDLVLSRGRNAIPLPKNYQNKSECVGCGRLDLTGCCPLPCHSDIVGRGQRSYPSRSRRAGAKSVSILCSKKIGVIRTFFSSGSVTVSARLLRALRIWLAATEVEVFSKALSSWISFWGSGNIGPATTGAGERMAVGEGAILAGRGL